MPRKIKKPWAVPTATQQAINEGTMLAIDPASGGSSQAGWALFKGGVLVNAGVIDVEKGNIGHRLRQTYSALVEDTVDVLAIERLRGSRCHVYLLWSVGVIVAAVEHIHLVEVPVPKWRAYAKATGTWTKSDDQDAVMIGECLCVQH